MPATGPGVASVRASVTRATIRQADRPAAGPGQRTGKKGRQRGGDGRPDQARLERFPDLGGRVLQRSHQAGKRPGGRPPSVARPPTLPARQTRL